MINLADKFIALGAMNGFPSCPLKLSRIRDIHLYHGMSHLKGYTLEEAMQIFWNLKKIRLYLESTSQTIESEGEGFLTTSIKSTEIDAPETNFMNKSSLFKAMLVPNSKLGIIPKERCCIPASEETMFDLTAHYRYSDEYDYDYSSELVFMLTGVYLNDIDFECSPENLRHAPMYEFGYALRAYDCPNYEKSNMFADEFYALNVRGLDRPHSVYSFDLLGKSGRIYFYYSPSPFVQSSSSVNLDFEFWGYED